MLLINVLHRWYLYHHVVQKLKILLSCNTIYSCFSNFLWNLSTSVISLCCIFIFFFLTWLIAHLSPWNLFSSPDTSITLIRPWYSKETYKVHDMRDCGYVKAPELSTMDGSLQEFSSCCEWTDVFPSQYSLTQCGIKIQLWSWLQRQLNYTEFYSSYIKTKKVISVHKVEL